MPQKVPLYVLVTSLPNAICAEILTTDPQQHQIRPTTIQIHKSKKKHATPKLCGERMDREDLI
jgi:hypothetical protein